MDKDDKVLLEQLLQEREYLEESLEEANGRISNLSSQVEDLEEENLEFSDKIDNLTEALDDIYSIARKLL